MCIKLPPKNLKPGPYSPPPPTLHKNFIFVKVFYSCKSEVELNDQNSMLPSILLMCNEIQEYEHCM